MNAIFVALFGAGVGAGVLIVVRALQPQPVPLARIAHVLDRPGVAVARPNEDASSSPRNVTGTQRRLSTLGMTTMRMTGIGERPKLLEQLRVLDKSLERHAYEKILGATAGLALPIFTIGAINAAGVPVSLAQTFQ